MELMKGSSGGLVSMVVFIWVDSFLGCIWFPEKSCFIFPLFIVVIQVNRSLFVVTLLVKSIISNIALSIIHHLNDLIGKTIYFRATSELFGLLFQKSLLTSDILNIFPLEEFLLIIQKVIQITAL